MSALGSEFYDVVIVGYGPVGAIAANLLGRYGINTAVIEREERIYHQPRAIVMDDEIMRLLQSIELIDAILPLTKVIQGEQFISSKRKVLATATIVPNDNGYAATNAFYQPRLEAVLRQGVERYPCVRVYSGFEVCRLEQGETSVIVTMRRTGKPAEQIRARYILGCDGAKSITRNEAGIRLLNLQAHDNWLVIDALLKDGEQGLESQYVQQYCNPRRPETYVPSVGRHRRWEFMLVKGESKEEMTRADKVGSLLSHWIDPARLEIVRAAVYTFHALIAQEWSNGRLFLLGDAAHQMPPFIGQGMCTGMRDAYNLCWKIALVVRGLAHPSILASYQQERLPHAYAAIHASVDLGKIVAARQPLAAIRDNMLLLLARLPGAFAQSMPPLSAGLLMRPSSSKQQAHLKKRSLTGGAISRIVDQRLAQGILFPQLHVCTASGTQMWLDEILGQDFAIVGLNVDPYSCLDVCSLPLWERLSTRFVQVNTASNSSEQAGISSTQRVNCVEDSEGVLARWFKHRPGTIAVVRPDRYVFGIFTPETLHLATERLSTLFF